MGFIIEKTRMDSQIEMRTHAGFVWYEWNYRAWKPNKNSTKPRAE